MDKSSNHKTAAENKGVKAAQRCRVFVGGSIQTKIITSEKNSNNTGLDAKHSATVSIGQDVTTDINQVTAGKHNPDPHEWEKDGRREWRDTIKDWLSRERPLEPYKLKGKCGVLILCNHFDDRRNKMEVYKKKRRYGAEADVTALEQLFENSLKCIVKVEPNVKGPEIHKILEDFQKDLLADHCDSCIVVVMSHGGKNANSILMDDMEERNFHRDFLYQFSHNQFPGFEGKPKIFLVQTCQDYGDEELGVEKGLAGEEAGPQAKRPESRHQDQDAESHMKALQLDFDSNNDEIQDVIVGFATIPYQRALRGPDGSIFIQSVVKIFREHAHKNDLKDMLKMVHDDVIQISKKVRVKKVSRTGAITMVQGNEISSVFDIGFKNYKFRM